MVEPSAHHTGMHLCQSVPTPNTFGNAISTILPTQSIEIRETGGDHTHCIFFYFRNAIASLVATSTKV